MADTDMDWVAVMDFFLELEDEFDITIPLNRLAEIKTVDDSVEAVGKLSSRRSRWPTLLEGRRHDRYRLRATGVGAPVKACQGRIVNLRHDPDHG